MPGRSQSYAPTISLYKIFLQFVVSNEITMCMFCRGSEYITLGLLIYLCSIPYICTYEVVNILNEPCHCLEDLGCMYISILKP